MNKKDITVYSIAGAVLLLLFISFCIFCPWSGLVWFVVWLITLVFCASAVGRNQQLQITFNTLLDQTRRAIKSAEMSNAHNEILMGIIDEMEKGADLNKATDTVLKKKSATAQNNTEDNEN